MPNIRLGLAAAILASASLAACSGESPLASDLNLVGTEPFWAVQISKEAKTAKFSRPGEADLDASYPVESKGAGGAVVLTSSSPDGDIVMTLTKKECSDGMSDRKYPWEASVAYKGQTLKGCAASKQFITETAQ
jgi:uncharacterized membrane protein